MKIKFLAIKLALFGMLFGLGLSKPIEIKKIYSDLPPECKTLNLETVESIPKVIEVNGKQFNIRGQIQHGATSRVFHAFEQHGSNPMRCMALKVVDLDKIEHKHKNQATNEAKILRELNNKNIERIPKLFEIEEHPTKKTISMAFELAHHDLFDEITPNMGQGKIKWVRNTFKDILQAVHPVHKEDIVHGDLKPENMAYFRYLNKFNDFKNYLGLNEEYPLILKVIDFGGVIKNEDLPNACEEIVTGTIMYMSPEQVAWCASHGDEEFMSLKKQFPLSPKSDIWSIGIILYQMIYGKSPYHWITKKYEHLDEEERGEKSDAELRQTIFDGKIPIEFDENYQDKDILEILKSLLERNPHNRPKIEEILPKLKELENKVDQMEQKIEQLEEENEYLKQQKEEEDEEKQRFEEEKLKQQEFDQVQEEMANDQYMANENWQNMENQFFDEFNNGGGFFPLQYFKTQNYKQPEYENNNNFIKTTNVPQQMFMTEANVFPMPQPNKQQQIKQQTNVFPFPQMLKFPKTFVMNMKK